MTVTSDTAPATARSTMRLTSCPTCSSMFFAFHSEKPGSLTVIEYPGPGTRAGAVKTPASFEMSSREVPFDALATVTSAPGILAPVASRTMPDILPNPAACAKISGHLLKHKNTPKTMAFFMRPPNGRFSYDSAALCSNLIRSS